MSHSVCVRLCAYECNESPRDSAFIRVKNESLHSGVVLCGRQVFSPDFTN